MPSPVQVNLAEKWEGKEITKDDDEFVFDESDNPDKFTPESRKLLVSRILDRIRSLRERIKHMSPIRRVFANRQMSRLEGLKERFGGRE